MDRLTIKIPFVSFEGNGIYGQAVAHLENVPYHPPRRIVVDGMEMPPDFNINSIGSAFVEKVEAITDPVVNDHTTVGVIFITLKHGLSASEIPSRGILPIKAIGFYTAREFYSPKYENPGAKKAPDFRTTVYWNPEIATDKNGSAKVDYYNADTAGSYRVVIEGIDSTGSIGRQVYHYFIKN